MIQYGATNRKAYPALIKGLHVNIGQVGLTPRRHHQLQGTAHSPYELRALHRLGEVQPGSLYMCVVFFGGGMGDGSVLLVAEDFGSIGEFWL